MIGRVVGWLFSTPRRAAHVAAVPLFVVLAWRGGSVAGIGFVLGLVLEEATRAIWHADYDPAADGPDTAVLHELRKRGL